MDASPTIRRVRPILEDAQALSTVEHLSLGDSAYTPAEMLAILERPEHYAYLACRDAEPVGLVSCFETQGCRLELDMLGVLPAHRGRGIATQLIAHAVGAALERGVEVARGVVAVGNAASRAAFERAGFQALADPSDASRALVHAMLVYTIRGVAPLALPPGWEARYACERMAEQVRLVSEGQPVGLAECLRVQTLCYSGLWVERLEWASDRAQRWLGRAIVERAKVLGLDEVGWLAPQLGCTRANPHAPRCLPLIREGYADCGDYVLYGMVAR